MSWIVALLARWGLSDAMAKRLAPLAGVIAVLAILAALWGAVKVWDHFDDKAAIERDRDAANAEAVKRMHEASEEAAAERLRNDRTNRDTEEAYHETITDPEAGDHPDPGVRLACERLRRDGQDTAGIPACGGR